MSEQLPTAAIARLITYPFPTAQGVGAGQLEATAARIGANSFGAGQVSAKTARVLNAATRLTLSVVASRQAAADELGDADFSGKMLALNKGTLERFRLGILGGADPMTCIPPVCDPATPDLVWVDDHYECFPVLDWDDGDGRDPDPITYGGEGKVAVGIQVLVSGEALPEGPLRDVVVEVGADVVKAGLDELEVF